MNFRNSKFFGKNSFLFVLSLMFFFCMILVIIIFKNNLNSNDVKLFGDNSIHLSNKLPLTDESAKMLDASNVDGDILCEVNFYIEGIGRDDFSVNYEVYVESDDSKYNSINPSYIRVYLTDSDGVPFSDYSSNDIPTYRKLKVSTDNPSGKILYSGSIKGKQKTNFKLRLWLDESYSLESNSRYFDGIIKVRKVV